MSDTEYRKNVGSPSSDAMVMNILRNLDRIPPEFLDKHRHNIWAFVGLGFQPFGEDRDSDKSRGE